MGDQSGIAVYAGKLFFVVVSFLAFIFLCSLVGLRCCVSVTVATLCHCSAVAAMAPWLLVLCRSRCHHLVCQRVTLVAAVLVTLAAV